MSSSRSRYPYSNIGPLTYSPLPFACCFIPLGSQRLLTFFRLIKRNTILSDSCLTPCLEAPFSPHVSNPLPFHPNIIIPIILGQNLRRIFTWLLWVNMYLYTFVLVVVQLRSLFTRILSTLRVHFVPTIILG